jgi:hypothetical protein
MATDDRNKDHNTAKAPGWSGSIVGLEPRLAEVGKIKIGGLGGERGKKDGGTFRLPVKYDHFVITTTERNAKGDLAPDKAIMDALIPKWADGDGKLRAIPIVLHSDDITEVFPHSYAAYNGKRLQCRGDGKTAERREIVDKRWTGKSTRRKCPCPDLEAKRCKPHGVLHCSIAVPGQAIAGGIHRWRTTSIISLQQMLGSLGQIQSLVGVLRGLPLVLRVLPMRVEPKGQRASTVYVCHVELRAAGLADVYKQALQLQRARNDLEAAGLALPAPVLQRPGDEPEEEQAEIEAEFYSDEPEAADGEPESGAIPSRAQRHMDDFRRPDPTPPPDAPAAPPEPVTTTAEVMASRDDKKAVWLAWCELHELEPSAAETVTQYREWVASVLGPELAQKSDDWTAAHLDQLRQQHQRDVVGEPPPMDEPPPEDNYPGW